MHIAILLAGHTNKAMPQRFHDYNDMFSDLFASLPLGKNFRFTTLAVSLTAYFRHRLTIMMAILFQGPPMVFMTMRHSFQN
jgi:hypothetical protein